MDMENNYRYKILLKEIDIIHSTIKNLDDIIYKTKNFAFLFWGGSLFLIANLELNDDVKISLILLTVLIPIMFWIIDFQWRKHLRMASQREKTISLFINSDKFEKWLNGKNIRFPLYDPVGWIFLKRDCQTKEYLSEIDEKYFTTPFKFLDILLYKDSKWYFSLMIIVSILFGTVYLLKGC